MTATPNTVTESAPDKVVTAKVPVKKDVRVTKTKVKAPPKALVKSDANTESKAEVKVVSKAVAKPKAAKLVKAKKPKLVRDSFTMPKLEYLVLDELKLRAVKLASPAKKTELIRAGIKALAAMTDANLLAALKVVPVIKTGRPTKG